MTPEGAATCGPVEVVAAGGPTSSVTTGLAVLAGGTTVVAAAGGLVSVGILFSPLAFSLSMGPRSRMTASSRASICGRLAASSANHSHEGMRCHWPEVLSL